MTAKRDASRFAVATVGSVLWIASNALDVPYAPALAREGATRS